MRLLVVEDDEKIASLLKRALEEEFFSVDLTQSAKDAIYLAGVNDYSVIMLDIMIKNGDGFEVCKTIREWGISTPIIILSAKSSIADKVSFLNLGANDFVTKPFSFDELLARINVWLRKKNQPSNLLKIADLKMDISTKEVSRAGFRIELNPKEYAILEYLLRNSDKIISQEELLASISDLDDSINSNVIAVYVYRLRQKIDKLFTKKLIKTYKNLGYKLGD